MSDKNVKVALVQQPPVFLNLPKTLAKAEIIAEECAKNGAKIIVFPETWLAGYPIWLDEAPKAALWDYAPAKRLYQYLTENSLQIPSAESALLQKIAKQNAVYIVIGVHEQSGGTLYNTTIYLAPDGDYKIHRKLTPTYTERLVWGVGDGSTLNVLETPYGILGGLICWEHWLPLARAAMHAKGEIIHTAQFPTVHERHQIASRHYAFEGQCFVLTSGCVMSKSDVLEGFESLKTNDKEVFDLLDSMEKDLLQSGGSAIIAPDASYVVEPVFDESRILYGELELDLVKQGRLLLDTDGHYSRPDVFELRVNEKPQRNVTFTSENIY
ncbi:MAG: carbon-nitrogen hydrolase family protein [Acidobacteriota bacterium]|nr:carbon-nitrogen hydrolase family protein [Acidobacteriota bacterium]